MNLHTYLPQDRLRALAKGKSLPDRTTGSALFADISGFTVLTESLNNSLGIREGAEELTRHLDAVFSTIIREVENYGGSVIGFAGDSLTCWFDDGQGPTAPRAAACAFALHQAMRAFSAIALPDGKTIALALKVSVASGPARRFLVGDPAIKYLDAVAGITVARMANGEHFAQKGDAILDEATLSLLGTAPPVREWRGEPETTGRFAVVAEFEFGPIPPIDFGPTPNLEPAELQVWVHHPIYERECSGQGSFLTEFRPCVAMFVYFTGIDFESDDAAGQLDTFIRQTQAIVTRYEGTLMQLTIGDKGSYLYLSLGSLYAHEDDALRAVKIALDLREKSQSLGFLKPLQIGITQGLLRIGDYGGPTRRDYFALGDDVNLAARLMQIAEPGTILLSGNVQKASAEVFIFEPRPPLPIKGKTEPLPVFSVTGKLNPRATRLLEPRYRLPMIGRQAELKLADEKLSLARAGQGQVIGIVAEAGMGKSRLVAEIIRLARKRGFIGYGGACQSSGTNTPYLVWQAIWQAFFDLDLEMAARKQVRLLEGDIEDRVPERLDALPLLGLVLDLHLEENDFTKALEPKDRKNALEALLEDCLKSAARETPLLIVLEDLHWVDPLSNDLLEDLVRISTTLPICFVLAYRPPDEIRYPAPRLEALPYFTKIELKNLTVADAEQLIRARLAQFYPERTGPLPKALAEQLTEKAEGNPFFIEELLNYLHDRGLNPYDKNILNAMELPASLQKLILSRIDQLTESQKVTLKLASVIGRVFPYKWLRGYYPALGDDETIKANLVALAKVDLTPLDTPEPELAYIFKHIITQEVAYTSLSFPSRAQFHELLAGYLESIYSEDPPISILTFHYSRSNNLSKKREYFQKSGEIAEAAFSNTTALDYFLQALAAAPNDDDKISLHINSGNIYQLIGKRDEAKAHFQEALEIATKEQMTLKMIDCEINLGHWWILHGEYPQAIEWLEKAHNRAAKINHSAGVCDALTELGIVYWRRANFDLARQNLDQGIHLARELGDKKKEAVALMISGQVSGQAGSFSDAHLFFDKALALANELNDKRQISGVLTNHGTTYYYEGNYSMAQKYMEEGLEAMREIGDKRGISIALNNMGNIFYLQNDFDIARVYYEESLALGREADDKYIKALSLSSLGITAFRQEKFTEADMFFQEGLGLNREMQDKVGLSLLNCYLGLLALAQNQITSARASFNEGLTLAHQSDIKPYAIYNLIGLACIFLSMGNPERATIILAAASGIAASIGFKIEPELQQPFNRTLAVTKAKLVDAEFQSAWEAGKGMTLEQAVETAMEETDK